MGWKMGVVAVGCFCLGALVSQLPGALRDSEPAPSEGEPSVKPPRLIFDPSSLSLLPDASLRLDLPEGPSLDGLPPAAIAASGAAPAPGNSAPPPPSTRPPAEPVRSPLDRRH